MDQPYRGIVEMYLGLQWYPAEQPDAVRRHGLVDSAAAQHQGAAHRRQVDPRSADERRSGRTRSIAGTITGSGGTIVIDHTTDNTLATFRWTNKDVKMSAAEAGFDLGGHHFAPGAFVISNANRAALEPQIRDLGLQAWATDTAPTVPRRTISIYRASATSTAGRARRTKAGSAWAWTCTRFHTRTSATTSSGRGICARSTDVILYPHAGVQVRRRAAADGGQPQPYKKTDVTPTIGTAPDQTDDRRGGLGRDGLHGAREIRRRRRRADHGRIDDRHARRIQDGARRLGC